MNQAVAFLVVCLLAAQQATAVSVCKQSELGSLPTNPNTTACAKDSGVVFADLNGTPTDAQLTSICKTNACLSLIATILAIDPEDCTLAFNENLNLMSELVDPVVEKCAAMGIDIAGSSRVGSGSGVDVVDDNSAASTSGASGSSSAASTVRSSTVAIAAVLAILALVH
ncbi:Elicitin [Phytophthora cinnamomi]|uniref:Elicitin n=1 Tax=Phytophthora cinnamomi TaxID=4785 RepID=UPI003559BF2D|nr:Elicitin [Phytophthora cinnamomi]